MPISLISLPTELIENIACFLHSNDERKVLDDQDNNDETGSTIWEEDQRYNNSDDERGSWHRIITNLFNESPAEDNAAVESTSAPSTSPPSPDRNSSAFRSCGLAALRLTCKDLNFKTFDFFAKAHFSFRHFMLSHFSLETLLHISKHPKLAPYVQTLVLGAHSLISYPQMEEWTHMDWMVIDSVNEWKYREMYGEQIHMWTLGHDYNIIAMALNNFKNCNTILIGDYESTDYGICYGKRTLSNETGWPFPPESYDDHGGEPMLSRLWTVALSVIEITKSPVHTIRYSHGDYGLKGGALRIPLRSHGGYRTALRHLRILEFSTLCASEDWLDTDDFDPDWPELLSTFLNIATNLSELTLHFGELSEIECGQLFRTITSEKPIKLNSLEKLVMSMPYRGGGSRGADLVGFLTLFQPSLRELSLRDWIMWQGSQRDWENLILRLQQDFELEYIRLEHLQTREGGPGHSVHVDFGFRPPRFNATDIAEYAEHRGALGMSDFLAGLQTEIVRLQEGFGWYNPKRWGLTLKDYAVG